MKAANQVVSFGKQLFSIRYVYSGSDFMPCSHEGSDPQKWYKNNSQRVSIHVPIMGATTEIAQICPLVRVSIHAPTKGALMSPTLRISCSFNPSSHEGSDTARYWQESTRCCFNPRSHEGSDSEDDYSRIADEVSIHAPTKGATLAFAYNSYLYTGFNPRSHEGERHGIKQDIYDLRAFQSTFPQGERPLYVAVNTAL